MGIRNSENEAVLESLKRFCENIESHDVYTIMKINCLLKLAVLEAFSKGTISQEEADRILFSGEDGEEGGTCGKVRRKTGY